MATEGRCPASSLAHKSRVLLRGHGPCHSVPILLSAGHSACLLPCPLPPADGTAGKSLPVPHVETALAAAHSPPAGQWSTTSRHGGLRSGHS